MPARVPRSRLVVALTVGACLASVSVATTLAHTSGRAFTDSSEFRTALLLANADSDTEVLEIEASLGATPADGAAASEAPGLVVPASAEPSDRPDPSATAEPSERPDASRPPESPDASETPEPTETAEPTRTSEPAPTPEPSEAPEASWSAWPSGSPWGGGDGGSH